MKVRIGNDIRMKVQASFGGGEDRPNIQFAKAYFINRTLKEKFDLERRRMGRFYGRFPIEPFIDEFEPTAYNINSAGYPRYRAFVFNSYRGFGVNPKWNDMVPFKGMNITEYRAEVEHTRNSDIVIVEFPAEAQLFTGHYDLILTADIYDAGYKNNVRTVTINYNDVFEIVSDSSEESGINNPVLIELDNTSSDDSRQDYYVINGSYGDNEIKLKRNDGGIVGVDITPVSGWYEGL